MAEEPAPTLRGAKLSAYVRTLIDAVTASDQRTEAAAQALQKAGSGEVRNAVLEMALAASDEVTEAFLKAALHSDDARLARSAAEQLVYLPAGPGALSLIEECLQMAQPIIRQRGIEALQDQADPRALSLLAVGLKDSTEGVRRAATSCLELIVGSRYLPLRDLALAALGDPQNELFASIVHNEDILVRRELAQAMAYAGSEQVLNLLSELSSDEDVQVRQEAVLALASIGTPAAIEIAAGRTRDASYMVASGVLDILATKFGRASAELLNYLEVCMRHPLAEVRRHAVLMLDKFEPQQVKDLLIEATKDGDSEVAQRGGEILRSVLPEEAVQWLGEEVREQAEEGQTFAIWEAGNIGQETGRPGFRKGQGAVGAEDILPVLESAVAQGSASTKIHAISELSMLVDIADSGALQTALTDEDASVRSRAAESLGSTRDAGFLVKTFLEHPDPLVRRRALEGLIDSPGGPREGGRLRQRQIRFTSTRTAGPELFSYFLRALEDPDEGVRQYGCDAVQHFVTIAGIVPVKETIEKLRAAAQDETASSLIRDRVTEVIERVEESSRADLIVESVNEALQWRGSTARHAHALRFDEAQGHFLVDPDGRLDPRQTAESWAEEFGLAGQEAGAVIQAHSSRSPLPDEMAAAVLKRLARAMGTVLELVCHASGALRLIGEERWAGDLQKWLASVKAGPALEWGRSKLAQRLLGKLLRLRKKAVIAATWAIESLAGTPNAAALDEPAQDEDDWVKIAALTARAGLEEDPTGTVNRLVALCAPHGRDVAYAEVVGPAAVLMLEHGQEGAAPLIDSALALARSSVGAEVTWKLLMACQKDEVVEALVSYLSGKELSQLSHLCMACAIRGGGHSVAKLDVPDRPPEGATVEVLCAYLALKAMLEEREAARQLEQMLRTGEGKTRYYSALYLGLARVWSATSAFAAVSDQEVHYLLRGVCAAMLIRRGHGGGLAWFRKVLEGSSGAVQARLSIQLTSALEDTIQLMRGCRDVNVGRFV